MKTFTKTLMIAAVLGTAISSTSFVASSSAASIEINKPGCKQALRLGSRELRNFLRKNRQCDAGRADRAPARSFEAKSREAVRIIKEPVLDCQKCVNFPQEEETGGIKGGVKSQVKEVVRQKTVVASEKLAVRKVEAVALEEKATIRVKAPEMPSEKATIRVKAPVESTARIAKAAPVLQTERAQLMKAN